MGNEVIGALHHSTSDLRVLEALAAKDVEIAALKADLQRIVDFPYIGAKAQAEIINIARGAIARRY